MAETQSAPTVGGSSSAGSVLGISVVEDQVASVVRDAGGEIIASNLVDLPDPSAQSAETAIGELVGSVPYEIHRIGVACARPATQNYLQANLAPDPTRPAWHDKVVVTDMPAALAEVARAQFGSRGIVAVIDLDRAGVPSPGSSVVTLDSATGEVLGTAEFAYGSPGPVTDPDHAGAVADAMTSAPGGSSVTSVLLTGPGAEMPGVAAAMEYALARPVTVAPQPALAPAVGAAVIGARRSPVGGASNRRWWLIGAALVGAVVLGAIAASAVLAGVDSGKEAAPPSTVTAPPSTITLTETPEPVTKTQTETEQVTATPDRETVTRTRTVTPSDQPTEEPSTVTETATETETVTETTTTRGTGFGGGPSANADRPGA
ncbi:hypothetical protein AAFP35_18125 [Gordonia sp. CPCC 206044]|uniref:hypothetical protein n=1 Tax=Gordonia sp. CPCC 206044 TaxID=3140793 RepID=UPI003AF34D37